MLRRDFLKGAAALFQAPEAVIRLRPAQPGAVISTHIYGHFIEHLGGVIYDGIWVGRDAKIPNIDGIRKDFVDDLKRLGAPNLRWPGGCFADGYHWRDGIGTPARRPRTYNFWHPQIPKGTDSTEPNQFGTHEFLRLCQLTGAAPYVAANVGTGSPREFYDWVLYCNAPRGTVSQAEERAANGHAEPFGVKYWGVGNESWGCGGNYKPQEYAAEYRRYIAQLPRYGEMYLIAAGPSGGDLNWTRGFFEALPRRARLDGWALHYYTHQRGTQKSTEFDAEGWRTVLEAGARMERLIEDHWKLMGEFDGERRVKLVVDEWGVWYPRTTEIGPQYLFSQMMTLRDALHTAINLDIFNRHADKVSMACVAQTINCIHSLFLARGAQYVRTPAYHVFEMYRPHMGARLVPLEAPPGLSGSCSRNEKRLALTLVNTSLDTEAPVGIEGAAVTEARGRTLTHADPRAANTFEAPDQVAPRALPVTLSGNRAAVRLPPKSVTAIELVTA